MRLTKIVSLIVILMIVISFLLPAAMAEAVSYTHLTLPTILRV